MGKSIFLVCLFFLLITFSSNVLTAQINEEQKKELKPVRNTFESIWLIGNQTVEVPFEGSFEWDIQHRFGTINNGYDDYYGLAAPSNIRLGFNYVPFNQLQVGFGITKQRKVWDFSLKYAFLKQKKGGGTPVSMTYLVTAGIDSRDIDFKETTDRFSYFHQLMIARKFSNRISLQLSPSISYFNFPDQFENNEGVILGLENIHYAISALGKVGISDITSIIFNIDIPLTTHEIQNLDVDVDPKANLSLGFEFAAGSHAFQLFVSNYNSIVPQYNHVLNQNEFNRDGILIGFNITRIWNF